MRWTTRHAIGRRARESATDLLATPSDELEAALDAVEDVIYELDGVQEAAVVGTPQDRLGEQVTAVVRGAVTADEVEGVCRDRLADYKVPRQVEFADELPKTSTRKIDKVALRDRLG